jgi:glutamate-1-semialdehyde-2,1-aminomutase
MFFMRTAGLEGKMDPNFLLHQAWVSECVKRGVFMTNHHNHFINCSLTEADIDFVGEVADEAFKVVKQRSREILAQA